MEIENKEEILRVIAALSKANSIIMKDMIGFMSVLEANQKLLDRIITCGTLKEDEIKQIE